jgi:tRNA (cytidine32/uridine32-2'-O)-methyltransferase
MTNFPRIVLVGTTHPGNIGAVARAMKNMALDRLTLVAPRIFPSAEATARASGADDLLAAARVTETLDEAIADCALVIGASARPRTIACPQLTPRQCAELLAAAQPGMQAAIVFGREHSGLSNEELDRCHYQLHIPSNPDFASLNLAAAVQIVAYEVYAARIGAGEGGAAAPDPDAGPVSLEEMERFYAHLEAVLVEIDFLDPAHPRHLMRRLRRLYNRLHPDRNEINILRGILKAVEDYAAVVRRRQGS